MSNSTPVSGASAPRTPQVVLEPNAKVTSVPKDLSDVKAPVKIEGEVVAQNRDGSVRVQTAQGNIDITLPKPPAEGQRVDVTLLPGRPPRQAVVENSSPQPSAPSTSAPPASEPPRSTQTPVKVDVPPPPAPPTSEVVVTPAPQPSPQPTTTQTPPVQTPTPAPTPVPPPQTIPVLETGAVVVAVPLTPALEAQIVTTLPDPIQSVVLEKIEAVAQTLVTQIENDIALQKASNLPGPNALNAPVFATEEVPTLLNILTPPPVVSSPLNVPQGTPALPTPVPVSAQVISNFVPPQNIANPLLSPQANQPASVTLQPTILTPTPTATPLLQTPILSADFSAPVLTRPMMVEIKNVTPPPVILTPPSESGGLIQKPDFAGIVQSLPTDTATLKTGIVTGFIQKNPVVSFFTPESTPLQSLLLQALPENISLGTQIQITPPSASTPGFVPTLPPGVAMPVSFLLPEPWPLLQQLTQVLNQIAPQAASAMANATPNPGMPTRFGPAALFFLAAVRVGDIGNWLGEKTMDILRRDGRGGMLSRLNQESSALNRLASEPVNNDWRAMSLPMYWNGEMHKMALYYRQDDGGGIDGEEKTAFTRFIFDLHLSRMGKVQLDGLFRPKKLDLFVRTEKSFSPQTQMELRRTYTGALEQTELSGELSFQHKPEQWMTIGPTNKELFSRA